MFQTAVPPTSRFLLQNLGFVVEGDYYCDGLLRRFYHGESSPMKPGFGNIGFLETFSKASGNLSRKFPKKWYWPGEWCDKACFKNPLRCYGRLDRWDLEFGTWGQFGWVFMDLSWPNRHLIEVPNTDSANTLFSRKVKLFKLLFNGPFGQVFEKIQDILRLTIPTRACSTKQMTWFFLRQLDHFLRIDYCSPTCQVIES